MRRAPKTVPSQALPPALRHNLVALMAKQPRLLRLLQRHGIHFCAGCYLTLSSNPERAAAYHGVPDRAHFLKEVERLLHPSRGRGHARTRH